jgi:hypothetical protein
MKTNTGAHEVGRRIAAGGGGSLTDGDKGDIVVSGAGTVWALDSGVVTTAGRALIDDADTAAQRTTLGLGTAATQASSAFEAAGGIDTHAALTTTHGITAFGASLVDDVDASTGRTTLGLGALATQSGTFSGTSSGTNTGDQTSIVGLSGTIAQFNAACSDADFSPTTHNHAGVYEAVGVAAAAVATHEGLADPHPVYLTAGEGNAAFEALGAVAAHAGAADPHPTYLTAAEGNTAYYQLAAQAVSFRLENRTSDPGSPATGQIWLRTDL